MGPAQAGGRKRGRPGLRLLKARVEDALASVVGRLDAASLAFARAIERTKDPATRAALYHSRALLFSSRKDLPADRRTAALADLDEAIRIQPQDSPEAAGNHVERARLLFGGRRHEEALASCAAAIRLVPDHSEAHRLCISSLLALRRYGEVLSSCESYLAREKPTVEILEMSGLARLAAEDHAGAIDDFPGPSASARSRRRSSRPVATAKVLVGLAGLRLR